MYEIESIDEIDENKVKIVLVEKVEVDKDENGNPIYDTKDGFGVDVDKSLLENKDELKEFLKKKVEERIKLLESLKKKEEYKPPEDLLGMKL